MEPIEKKLVPSGPIGFISLNNNKFIIGKHVYHNLGLERKLIAYRVIFLLSLNNIIYAILGGLDLFTHILNLTKENKFSKRHRRI